MNKTIIASLGIIILAVVAFAIFSSSKPSQNSNDTSPQTNQQMQPAKSIEGYSGKLIAGSTSPFLEFNREDYEKAKAEGKVIFLDFYANWCPVCRAEAPVIHSGFDKLRSENVVGFRVNFNDSETDEDEKTLAKEFNVPYQYTKIIIKDSKEVVRSGTKWEDADFAEAFSKVL